MNAESFIVWFNGVAFGSYAVFAFTLFHSRNIYNVPRRAFIAASCLMLFLAALMLRYMFENPEAEIYCGEWANINVMENIFTYPLVMFIPMELSHYRRITLATVVRHLLPFVVGFAAYLVALHEGWEFHNWIFLAYMTGASIYVLYYMVVLRRAANVFEKELHNTYANSEGRAFAWYTTIAVLVLLLVFIYVVLHIVYDDQVSLIYRNIAGLFFWSGLAAHVLRMRESPLIDELGSAVDATPSDKSAQSETDQTDKEEFTTEQLDSFTTKLEEVLSNQDLLCRDDLSREDVAKAMDTNHILLTRMLKEAKGMTFSEYICNARLAIAAEKLSSTTEGIEQILYGCGFRSRATFHRAFTKRYHCSPTDYRRANTMET